ncbi:MAG: hypothetical protein ACK56I_19030 [bacterium]
MHPGHASVHSSFEIAQAKTEPPKRPIASLIGPLHFSETLLIALAADASGGHLDEIQWQQLDRCIRKARKS